jgi:hypothetical protein
MQLKKTYFLIIEILNKLTSDLQKAL